MITVDVSPDDLKFPLGKKLWESANIWYHGTSNIYSEKIETCGWQAGDLPYSINDIKRVVDILDTIRVRGTPQDVPDFFDSILYNYTLEGKSEEFDKRSISLTRDYWRARNYASLDGGETIDALLRACRFFSSIVNDGDSRRIHRQRLQDGIDDFYKHNIDEVVRKVESLREQLKRLKSCQSTFEDRQYLKACVSEIDTIREKYESVIGHGHPVVYAVEFKTSQEVLEFEGKDPYNERWASWIETERIGEDISPNKIVARIDFLNGIPNNYLVVFGHWIKNKLLPWGI